MDPAIAKIVKQLGFIAIPMTGYAIGKFLDDKETERMTRFRDKSALYGRTLGPNDKPSWPAWQAE